MKFLCLGDRTLGADVMAATAAAFNLDILCYIFVNAFGQACTTFVGQNYGAGDMARCRRVGVITTLQNLVVCVIIGAPILYFSPSLLALFTSDVMVISYGVTGHIDISLRILEFQGTRLTKIL